MEFQFTPQAIKDLKQLDKATCKKFFRKLMFWTSTEDPMKFSKSIQGHRGLFRFRVDDCRLIVFLNHGSLKIEILKVGHRSNVHKTLNNIF